MTTSNSVDHVTLTVSKQKMSATKKSKKTKNTLDVATVTSQEESPAMVFEEMVETPEEASFRNKETINTVMVLLFFSALMFSLPFAAFFGVRHYLGTYMHVVGFANTCWSVLSAVVTANVVIIAYVYVAYRDNQAEIAREKLKAN